MTEVEDYVEKVRKSPADWNALDVAGFLKELKLGAYADAFCKLEYLITRKVISQWRPGLEEMYSLR